MINKKILMYSLMATSMLVVLFSPILDMAFCIGIYRDYTTFEVADCYRRKHDDPFDLRKNPIMVVAIQDDYVLYMNEFGQLQSMEAGAIMRAMYEKFSCDEEAR